MGEDVEKDHFRKQDFSAFAKRLREETDLVAALFADRAFADDGYVVGFELEAWLIDPAGDPSPVNEPFLRDLAGEPVVAELARFNFEVNGRPQPLAGGALGALHRDLLATWRLCERRARDHGARVMMIGILPTVREDHLVLANMSGRTRFRALNEQIMRMRRGEPLRLEIHGREELSVEHRDVMLESATTSFQIHLQTPPGRAARVYNAALILSAPMTALAANAPFLFGRDLWDETRITVFEQAVGINPRRVTFGEGYARHSLLECFVENLELHPVLLPTEFPDPPERLHHVRLHNGTIWRWNRPLIGFGAGGVPHLRIEHRVVSAGPTIMDLVANTAFFLGLVTALAAQDDPPEALLGFEQARSNFYAAARFGFDARIVWLDGAEAPLRPLLAERLLPLARQGLDALGIDADERDLYLGVIGERLRSGRNGAAWQRAYVRARGADMHALAQAYHRRQSGGAPVHEWTP